MILLSTIIPVNSIKKTLKIIVKKQVTEGVCRESILSQAIGESALKMSIQVL